MIGSWMGDYAAPIEVTGVMDEPAGGREAARPLAASDTVGRALWYDGG